MMLWSKEPLYTDLFTSNEVFKELRCVKECESPTIFSKSDVLSIQKRNEGNELFAEREWTMAMEKYNDSLCFAEPGSENISLAYGNRSACFFHLKLYEECLADIELAIKADYPERLMQKLDRRTAECLNFLKNGRQPKNDGYKLNSEPDKKFPFMGNVLKIERNNSGEYSVVAKRDLGVFETVMIEKPTLKYLFGKYGTKCNICLKDNANLVPCDKCTTAMFCCNECQRNFIHDYECGLKFSDDPKQNHRILSQVRAILMVLNMFSWNVNDVMLFVEQTIESEPKKLPDSMMNEKSKYQAFLKYGIDSKYMESKDFGTIVFNTFNLLLKFPKINSMFQLKAHRRFLMHLIGHHACIMDRHLILAGDKIKGGPDDHFSFMLPMTRYFKQAYSPNLLNFYINNNKNVYVTSGTIKKGEQLSIAFQLTEDVQEYERKKNSQRAKGHKQHNVNILKLKKNCKPNCKCARCTRPTAIVDAEMMKDPDLDNVLSLLDRQSGNEDDMQELVNNLHAFSMKHGPTMMMFNEK